MAFAAPGASRQLDVQGVGDEPELRLYAEAAAIYPDAGLRAVEHRSQACRAGLVVEIGKRRFLCYLQHAAEAEVRDVEVGSRECHVPGELLSLRRVGVPGELCLAGDGACRAAADAGELQDVRVAPVQDDIDVCFPGPAVLADVRRDAPAVHEAVEVKVKRAVLLLARDAEGPQVNHPECGLVALDRDPASLLVLEAAV